MKPKSKQALTFLSGLMIGIILFSTYSFISVKNSDKESRTTEVIDLQTATEMTSAYQKSAAATNAVIKAYSVNLYQLNSMNTLQSENRSLTGFRIYFGLGESGSANSIVVGIDRNGKDVTSGSIFKTDLNEAGICPPVCDKASPLNH